MLLQRLDFVQSNEQLEHLHCLGILVTSAIAEKEEIRVMYGGQHDLWV